MAEPFNILIDRKGFGLVEFDVKLQVIQWNSAAADMLTRVGGRAKRGDLLDLFPELFGADEQLARVIALREPSYALDLVQRRGEAAGIQYWNILVLPAPDSGGGMLVMENATDTALGMQALNQQRYDRYLFRESIDHRRNQLGTWFKGRSAAIREIVETVQKLASVPSATVLLMGETGTGKNMTARMIHESATPADKPFVEINCAALPEQLIEAELFGYEKGAFTHAVASKPGLLEEAHGGTLFLDEIGELSMSVQAKLLSMIESKSFRRLGSTTSREVEIRIIAATNRDLQAEVAGKRFRDDLFYRLNVVSLVLPPLRELGDDVVMIAKHFVELFNVEFKKKVKGLSSDACRALKAHTWPGNVRELSNCIERAMIFAEDDVIGPSDLVMVTPADGLLAVEDSCWTIPSTGIDLEDVERRLIRSALNQAADNKSKAARLLGLTRHTLRYRMEKHGMA